MSDDFDGVRKTVSRNGPIPEDDEFDLNAADDEVDTEAPDDDEDDVEIGFEGDEAEESSGNDLVRHLRAKLTETQAELAKRGPAEPAIVVGERPTMESCDYDEARFEQELDAWKDRSRDARAQDERVATAQNQGAEAITNDLKAGATRFAQGKKAMRRPDFDIAETSAFSTLNDMQQAAILQIADDPAKFVYALGRSAGKLKELAAITNPFKFSAAVQELKGKITVKTKRQGVEPDEPVRGSARMAPGSDKKEEKLEAEALKTGDRTKLIAYRREKKSKAR